MATLWGSTAAREAHHVRGRGMAWRIGILVGAGVFGAARTAALPHIHQDPAYFAFVDGRTLLGVRNALNVLSNAAFALVGAAGLLLLFRGRLALRTRRERWPWAVFFAGVALTSVGSAWFHLGPDNESLVWDRLPMAVGFMGLLAALIAERVDRAAGVALLGPLVLAGVASVLYWIATERAGDGDLRPYLFVQYYPLACILLVLALFPPAYTGSAGWIVGLAAYATAKWAEAADGPVYAALGAVSGHTLKHLLAAAGIASLLVMLRLRRPVAPGALVMPRLR
jgi:hypothetical protein